MKFEKTDSVKFLHRHIDIKDSKLLPYKRSCEDTLPPLSYFDYQSDEKRISLRDRDRLRNDPQWVPGFLSCCSWMFPERLRNIRTCGFRRNSSSFDRAPKIRDSDLLNSFESFLVIFPSISSETWEMYS